MTATVGIDLQARNSRRKYPFVDYADMRYAHSVNSGNAGDFPTDAVLNAQFICPEISFVSVHLLSVTVAVSGANRTVAFLFRLRPVEHASLSPVYRRDDLTISVTATIVPGQVAPPDWLYASVSHLSSVFPDALPPVVGSTAKLLLGAGVLTVAGWDVGVYNMLGVPRILPSLAIHYSPGLQYISIGEKAYSGDVRFAAGSSADVSVDPVGGSISIDAGPEYGKLSDCGGTRECASADLLHINGVHADQKTGDLVLAGIGDTVVRADYDAMVLVITSPPPANCRGTGGS